jgi:septal ring factor EnvC (AmiA/AmiB activator)
MRGGPTMTGIAARVSSLIIIPIFILAFGSGSSDACQGYRQRFKKASREMAQFERLVVVPLQAKGDRLQKELDQEINLPDELRGKIVDLEKRIRELEAQEASLSDRIAGLNQRMEKLSGEIEDLDGQIEEAVSSGKKKIVKQLQAQREEKLVRRKDVRRSRNESMDGLGKTQGGIDARRERIARYRELIDEIVSQPPSRMELEEALAEVKESLRTRGG